MTFAAESFATFFVSIIAILPAFDVKASRKTLLCVNEINRPCENNVAFCNKKTVSIRRCKIAKYNRLRV